MIFLKISLCVIVHETILHRAVAAMNDMDDLKVGYNE